MCPVCDKPAEFRSLRIDGLFLEILKTSDSDEIDFTEDGNWHCAKKKTEALVNTNKPIGEKHKFINRTGSWNRA